MSLAINKEKIYSIQNLRGIAALSVCLFHFTSIQDVGDPIKRFSNFGYLGVQIFFIISGFVIPWSLYTEGYKISNFFSFLIKRLARIEPPYIVSILLLLMLNYLSSRSSMYYGDPFALSWKQILLHIIYLPEYFGFSWFQPVYATLLIEFQFYILLGLIFPLLQYHNRFALYGVAVGLMAISYFNLIPVALFKVIDLFLIGMIYFKYRIGHLKEYEFGGLLLVIMAFTMFTNPDKVIVLVMILTVACMIYWKSNSPVTQFLGKISYSLYLIHITIGGRIVNLGYHFSHSRPMSYLYILVATVVSITCAWLFYKLIELPSMHFSKKMVKSY